jgi:predicted O-methyltransferase YrrM
MAADKQRPHNPEEYVKLLEWCKGAKSILEIGSRFGFTLVDLAHGMSGKRIVSVDLPESEGWHHLGSEAHLRQNVESLRTEGYDAQLFIGDSKDPEIIKSVAALGPFDVVFIDGDHTYEGVSHDWKSYGHLGKMVVFHDIRQPQPSEWMGLGVWRLWEELKGEKESFIAKGSKMGIGRVGGF